MQNPITFNQGMINQSCCFLLFELFNTISVNFDNVFQSDGIFMMRGAYFENVDLIKLLDNFEFPVIFIFEICYL